MRFTDPSQLAAGMEIFEVCSFGCGSHVCSIYRYEILDVPVAANSNSKDLTFIKLRRKEVVPGCHALRLQPSGLWNDTYRFNLGSDSKSSMKDMGIIPNTYNMHQAFSDLDEARQYALTGGTKLSKDDIVETKTDSKIADYDRAMRIVGG